MKNIQLTNKELDIIEMSLRVRVNDIDMRINRISDIPEADRTNMNEWSLSRHKENKRIVNDLINRIVELAYGKRVQ